ncbi:MAG: 3-phosphoshikimate 1-carboxyvinyltransferase [Thermoleophilia bacterium]|nr:3-phosphoshikimate 1-carboxyvinyltransferase [Thermoleophilia bacterium]
MADRSVRFEPARDGLRGTVRVPADKSISHRAAIISAVCDSPCVINNYLRADDTNATLKAIAACGVRVDNLEEGDPVVHGAGLRGLSAPAEAINIGNSGTSIRLLPGIFAGQKGTFVLDGDASIRRRPMDRIVTPLRLMGVNVEAGEGNYAPLAVTGGPVKAIDYELPMASAQVKSTVLLAGLFGDGPTSVTEPLACRDHTEILLSGAGVRMEKKGLKAVVYPPDRLSLESVDVEADFSSAAFFIVAATLVPGSEITLEGVGVNPTRTGLLDIMEEMGADIRLSNERWAGGELVADMIVRSADLHGVEVDPGITGRCIDELPLVALLGAYARGDTVVRGAAELRVKESNRLSWLAVNLKSLGVDIKATYEGFFVKGGEGIGGGAVKSMGDHRMAMLGAVAGLASREGIDVIGFGCVAVSFPGFEKSLAALRAGNPGAEA